MAMASPAAAGQEDALSLEELSALSLEELLDVSIQAPAALTRLDSRGDSRRPHLPDLRGHTPDAGAQHHGLD